MKKLLKWIVVICVIIAIGKGALLIINHNEEKAVEGVDYFLEDEQSQIAELEGLLKEEESEIEGMTRYDKQQMGLSPYGTDSDNDGLSDKDEIEKYGTDPKKKSTAGDLYSDSYKVEHGMDLFTAYEYEGEYVFPYSECSEVIFTATTIEDFESVSRTFPAVKLSEKLGYTIFKAYEIYNNSNKVSIDLTDTLAANNVSMKDIDVYVQSWNSDTPERCKYSEDNNIITLKEILNDGVHYVYIVNKKEADKVNSFFNMFFPNKENTELTEAKGLVYGSPTLALATKKMTVWYNDTGNPELNEAVISKMTAAINYQMDTSAEHFINSASDNIKAKTVQEIDNRYKMLQTFLPSFENDGNLYDQPLYQLLFNYYTYDSLTGYSYDGEIDYRIKGEDVYNGFTIAEDTLPFGNFNSYISEGGNCLGIATLTAKLYNTGPIPTSGEYKGIKWTIAGDEENVTLTDPGLHDYKTESFVTDHTSKNTKLMEVDLSEGESQFINMVGAFWDQGNREIIYKKCYFKKNGETNYNYYKIEQVKAELSKGKVLSAGFSCSGIGSHAVNIYGYEEEESGSTTFYVYDNNYPGMEGLTFKVTPERGEYDHTETFSFVYETPNYTFDSKKAEEYRLMVMDEDFNIIMGSDLDEL